MKRSIFYIITLLIVIAMVPGGGVANAQTPTPEDASAVTSYAHLFLVADPLTSTVWWGSQTVVDSAGGVSVVYNDSTNIYYAHCAANCAASGSWAALPIFPVGKLDALDFPSLVVDSSNRPRLMWFAQYDVTSNYYYAACDSNCTASASNWTKVAVTGDLSATDYPDRFGYFTLDAYGRPRMVHGFYNPPSSGFYYEICNSSCLTKANWHTTNVVTPNLNPSLLQIVFDPSDRPRVLGYDDQNSKLVYAQCDGTCTAASNWGSLGLFSPVYYGSVSLGISLRVNAQGYPRIAYFDGNVSDNVVHYAWSNSNSLSSSGWSSYIVNYPADNDDWSVDLGIDSQGRPRIVYATDKLDLGYLTCTANCETNSPTWQQETVEKGSDLDASNPIGTTPGCLSSNWMINGYPSMALDAANNLNVSYWVRHGQLCKDAYGKLQIMYDAKAIRFAAPGSSGTPVAPVSVSISGPHSGGNNTGYTFTAAVSPSNATTPITYVWQATGLASQTHTGADGSDTATFTWPTGANGAKTVSVTVTNAAGSVTSTPGSGSLSINIAPVTYSHWVYLPSARR